MNNLTVAKKILLSFIVLIVFFAGFGIYANYAGSELNSQTADLKDWTDGLAISSNLADAANEAYALGASRFTNVSPERQQEITKGINDAYKKVDDVFARYDKMLADTDYEGDEQEKQEDQKVLSGEKELWKAYRAEARKASELLEAGDSEGALQQFDTNGRAAYKKFIEAVKIDEEESIKATEEVKNTSDDLYASIFRNTVILLIVVIAITILAAIWLNRTISGGVQAVFAALRQVADGDLRVKLDVTANDEFAQMGGEFNKMLENVRKMTQKIQSTAHELSGASDTLMNTAEQSATATQNVAQSITEVAGASQNQMEFLEETKQQVDSFRKNIHSATELLASVVGDVQNTSKRANEGNTLVLSTVDQMNTIADGVQTAAGVVSKLGERSKEIGDIVEVIAGISAQTNLLALNAAIEAARAGEHGRGFAVVAEEVRKLAEESSQASQKIGDLIGAIQEETGQAVTAMQEGRDQAEEGRENVRATGEGFSEILGMIQNVRENSESIQKTMKMLNESAGKIADATAKIYGSAKQVASESENVSAATEEQAASMNEIAGSCKSLADHAEELSAAAGKFKT